MDYSQDIGTFGDIDHFYFQEHSQFKFGEDSNFSRIKSLEYKDEQEKVTYSAIFAYDQIGVSFTISTENSEDRVLIFKSLLSRAIRGYKNFKQYFLNKICPKFIRATFESQRLLVSLHRFIEDLSPNQQKNFLQKIKCLLKEYTSDIIVVLTNKNLGDYSNERSIHPLTLKELEDMSRFDFNTIIIVLEDIYLYVSHHLFAKWFILEDPSLSLRIVATWGFISALKLKDLHYEIEDYFEKVERMKSKIYEKEKSLIPTGLRSLREQILELERERVSIEDDLQEFTTLSSKIYEGIEKSECREQIRNVLEVMDSLPHSIFQAYSILELKQLGRFKSFKRTLINLSLQLKKLEMKFNKRTIGLFICLLVLISAIVYTFAIEISYVADILQILTFIVTFVVLVLRFLPTR